MNKNIRIELNWDVPNNECISVLLDEEDSKRFRELVKQYGLDFQVFSDYEDE